MAVTIEKGKELYAEYAPRLKAVYDAWQESGQPAPAASPFTPPDAPPVVPPPAEPERTFSVGMGALLGLAGLAVAFSLWSSRK